MVSVPYPSGHRLEGPVQLHYVTAPPPFRLVRTGQTPPVPLLHVGEHLLATHWTSFLI